MTTKNQETITGDISVHTGNILPIIKKWLYSEQDIFLRELISNAHDAILKRQKIALKENLGTVEGCINITLNAEKKTLTLSDNGLGMDSDEIQKYINQIAFSGAEEFVKKYEDKKDAGNIIGHFGLGFYSAFMAADQVEIESRSYRADAKAINWKCDGGTKFEITPSEKQTVGTDIILHLNTESEKYLKNDLVETLIKKYDNFLPVEIQVEGKKINDQNPLWVKNPTDVTDEDYKVFYQTLFPFSQEPLFWIHLNVDFPFNLKGILYFPKLQSEMDFNKGQVKLFCRQVFVTDNSKEVLPEFLSLLKGAIDCPDIPLNVSRSYLQQDAYVQKISKHIVKKIAEKLTSLFKNDRENFEKYWEDIHPFIKYGMMQDTEFYEKVKDITLFKTASNTMTTLAEYLERNKTEKVVYASDKQTQAAYISACQQQGLEVLILDNYIDTHFIQFLESKDSKIKYQAVDNSLSEAIEEKAEVTPKETDEKLTSFFKEALGKDLKIEIKPLKTQELSALIVEAEFSKRLKSMSVMMKGDFSQLPTDETLILNQNSPIITKIDALAQAGNTEDATLLAQYVYDLALLSQKPLTGEQMQAFIARSNKVLGKL